MRQSITSLFRLSLLLLIGMPILLAQDTQYVAVNPGIANLVIGQSQRFRIVDQNGRMQRNVSWTISDREAFAVEEGDEMVLTAKTAGTYQITGRVSGGSAQADIKIISDRALPTGSVKWSVPSPPGCKTVQIVPAVPSDSGVDVYESSTCPDGTYVAAYTEDGIQVYRQKVGGPGQAAPQVIPTFTSSSPSKPAAAPRPALSSGSTSLRASISLASVCDQIALGAAQEHVRELLKSRNLLLSAEGPSGHVWVVAEATTQCKLWFDDKAVLTRKSKTLVSE